MKSFIFMHKMCVCGLSENQSNDAITYNHFGEFVILTRLS